MTTDYEYDVNMPKELGEQLEQIIDDKLGDIMSIIKSELSEPEPDYRIIKALKRYFR